jgi:hypothetical protein
VQRSFVAALQRLLAQQEVAQLSLEQQQALELLGLEQPDQGLQWCAANRAFVDGRVLTLSAAYLALLREHYGDSSRLVQAIDFRSADEAAQVGPRRATV